ncbi:DUF6653 family protein [Marinomonas sp. THO17]|uniref:DUF6653 family protein n=1 Tax=Marinomonas sp. THO17 TaxID=3149048 RepID=UPI00336BEA37
MDITKWAEKIMTMDNEAWQRHANPWSVYSRFSILPLLSLAIWSRQWLDFYSLPLVLLCLLWIWLNPRVFPAPKDFNNWASKGTFGERLYLNRHNEPIPPHHLKMGQILLTLSALGMLIWGYGIWALDLPYLLLGNVWVMTFKAWFVDRMVWLYDEVKRVQA